MKIDGPARTSGTTRRNGVARSGNGFSVRMPGAGQASATPPATPLSAPGALLSLQEVDTAAERRRARERGHDVLDVLEDLRLAMIEDRLSEGALRRLAALTEALPRTVDDERLAGVLRQIDVRAAVEIAKREGRDQD